MARIYATPQEFADWLGLDDPPTGAERALRAASRDVDELLLTAVYDADEDGLPTDPKVAEALQEATCAQAEYARALGDPVNTGAQQFGEVAIGSARLVRSMRPPEGMPERWSHQAVQILQQAGLTGHAVWTC